MRGRIESLEANIDAIMLLDTFGEKFIRCSKVLEGAEMRMRKKRAVCSVYI